jgi:predicted nucleotidyltransferase component of viral defense system
MKDVALQLARQAKSQGLNVLREYLQNYLLWLIQKKGMNLELFFVGGTALRFLHRLPRYSEDLDYSAGPGWKPARFAAAMKGMQKDIQMAGYDASLHLQASGAVHRADWRFAGLLADLELAGRKEQKLSVSIEVDAHPPSGWKREKTVVNIHIPVLVQHYDLASMLAGKVAAILTRPNAKGRDFYDLFWYLTKWATLEPNIRLLNNALAQKTKAYGNLNSNTWKTALADRVGTLSWRAIEQDVRPFLERPEDILAFNRENLLALLG